MSLLMEALRKAEEAKRKIQDQGLNSAARDSRQAAGQPAIAPVPIVSGGAASSFILEEHEDEFGDYIVDNFLTTENTARIQTRKPEATRRFLAGKPARASIEELQNYLETTPELEEATHVAHSDPALKIASTAQQRAAGSVFAAKQKPARSHATRNILWVLLVSMGAGIAWYFSTIGGSSLMLDPALLNADIANRSLSDEQMLAQSDTRLMAQNAVPAAVMPEPTQNPAGATETVAVSDADAEYIEAPLSESTADDEILAPATPAFAVAPAVPATDLAQGRTAATTQLSPGSATAENPSSSSTAVGNPAGVLEVSRNTSSNRNNQQLLNAYASLQAGDLAAASPLYRRVLEQLPNNRDALLGSASIALRQGRIMEAREFYSRLMQLNPKDPLARTGLLQTIQDIDQQQYAQELLRLLQQFPEVAPLSFALGNVYASQQRWHEAQNAYFDALLFARKSNEGVISPDYAYNLAVSLEQINQPGAALGYYKQAESLARDFTPGFDMLELSRRISFLEPNRP